LANKSKIANRAKLKSLIDSDAFLEWYPVLLAVVVALLLRLPDFTIAYIRVVSFSEGRCALIAYQFYQGNFSDLWNYYHPAVPIYPFLCTFLWWIFGIHEWLIRIPCLIASCATIPLVYLLGKTYFGRVAGLSSAWVFVILPLPIITASNGHRGALVMLFAVILFLMITLWTENRNKRYALLSWFFMALVLSMWFSMAYLLLPIGYLMLRKRGWKWAWPRFLLLTVLALLPWIILRWNIFIRLPELLHGAEVGSLRPQREFESWFDPFLISRFGFFIRYWGFTSFGLVYGALGLILPSKRLLDVKKIRGASFLRVWLFALLCYVAVDPTGFRDVPHYAHYLQISLLASLLIGKGIAQLTFYLKYLPHVHVKALKYTVIILLLFPCFTESLRTVGIRWRHLWISSSLLSLHEEFFPGDAGPFYPDATNNVLRTPRPALNWYLGKGMRSVIQKNVRNVEGGSWIIHEQRVLYLEDISDVIKRSRELVMFRKSDVESSHNGKPVFSETEVLPGEETVQVDFMNGLRLEGVHTEINTFAYWPGNHWNIRLRFRNISSDVFKTYHASLFPRNEPLPIYVRASRERDNPFTTFNAQPWGTNATFYPEEWKENESRLFGFDLCIPTEAPPGMYKIYLNLWSVKGKVPILNGEGSEANEFCIGTVKVESAGSSSTSLTLPSKGQYSPGLGTLIPEFLDYELLFLTGEPDRHLVLPGQRCQVNTYWVSDMRENYKVNQFNRRLGLVYVGGGPLLSIFHKDPWNFTPMHVPGDTSKKERIWFLPYPFGRWPYYRVIANVTSFKIDKEKYNPGIYTIYYWLNRYSLRMGDSLQRKSSRYLPVSNIRIVLPSNLDFHIYDPFTKFNRQVYCNFEIKGNNFGELAFEEIKSPLFKSDRYEREMHVVDNSTTGTFYLKTRGNKRLVSGRAKWYYTPGNLQSGTTVSIIEFCNGQGRTCVRVIRDNENFYVIDATNSEGKFLQTYEKERAYCWEVKFDCNSKKYHLWINGHKAISHGPLPGHAETIDQLILNRAEPAATGECWYDELIWEGRQ